MSTLEEFEAAPAGATATRVWKRAVKTFFYGSVERNWLTRNGECLSARELVERDWTLDPPPAGPATAREALDLAWELAYPVKEGQTIPEGADYLASINGERIATTRASFDIIATAIDEKAVRTLDPLPEPEPDWLTAPAVLATHEATHDDANPIVWTKHQYDSDHWISGPISAHWTSLRNVTPLYPKGQDA